MHSDSTHVWIPQEDYAKLAAKYSAKQLVGTELKKLISWFPVSDKKNCSRCRHLEARMNRWGADICKEKKDFIVKKLGIAAKRRGLPFSPSLVGLLVDKAIRNSRKT